MMSLVLLERPNLHQDSTRLLAISSRLLTNSSALRENYTPDMRLPQSNALQETREGRPDFHIGPTWKSAFVFVAQKATAS